MQTVTITADEFKAIHNALCFAQTTAIDKTVDTIREALQGAYRQEAEAFDSKTAYYDRFKDDNALKAIWSIYELPEHGFLGNHPYPSDAVIVYRDHWGKYPVKCAVNGTTWADIYRAADTCIGMSGDSHHCFIEGFTVKNGNELHMITGS